MVVNERNGKLIASFPVASDDDVMLVTDAGKTIRMPVEGDKPIRIAGRSTQGVILFDTEEGEHVVSVERVSETGDGAEEGEDGGPSETSGEGPASRLGSYSAAAFLVAARAMISSVARQSRAAIARSSIYGLPLAIRQSAQNSPVIPSTSGLAASIACVAAPWATDLPKCFATQAKARAAGPKFRISRVPKITPDESVDGNGASRAGATAFLAKSALASLTDRHEPQRPVVPAAVEIVEQDSLPRRIVDARAAADDDDPPRAVGHKIREAGDEQKVCDVVHEELLFDAVDPFERTAHHAGIGDDRVERAAEPPHGVDRRKDRGYVGEIAGDGSRRAAGPGASLSRRRVGAGEADNMRAMRRERAHRLETDPAVGRGWSSR
jgi:hypothetical protein